MDLLNAKVKSKSKAKEKLKIGLRIGLQDYMATKDFYMLNH